MLGTEVTEVTGMDGKDTGVLSGDFLQQGRALGLFEMKFRSS